MDIFKKLDNLINHSNVINESDEHDDVVEEIDPEYSTSKQGERAAAEQIMNRLFTPDEDDDFEEPGGGGKSDMSEIDSPLKDLSKTEGSEDGEIDKRFKSSKMDDMDDLDTLDDEEKSKSGKSDMSDEDFEFDDFDYEDNPESGKGEKEEGDLDKGSGSDSDSDEYEDGDFEDGELGDEDDYDFGDDGDYEDDNPVDDPTSTDSETSTGSGLGSGERGSGGSSSSSGSSGSSGSDDVDYDDTLDYDSKNYDSIEDEIEDALDRAREGSSSKSEKDALDKMKESFGEDNGKSSKEKADDLSKEINDATDDENVTGSGELAGESLDKTPDDGSLEEDMKKAGFDDKDIEDMKKSKDVDTSDKIDEDKVAKEAMEEMDKRAKSKGETSGSSLSRTIMRSVLKGEVTNMEWKEMVSIFLRSKSRSSGTSLSKSKSTSWGDKKHLWRDAILPKTTSVGGDIDEINCFIDFSGSVSQPLVFSFLKRVLSLCGKLSFGKVNVYGFAYELSTPYVIKKKDITKDETKTEEYLNKMWEFIDKQGLNGCIENFEEVAKEILKLKRKNHDCPIFIFGDGLWATSYDNPKPPVYLKDICSRYLKDILVLIYYDDNEYWKEIMRSEIGYLKDIANIKHIVTTELSELK